MRLPRREDLIDIQVTRKHENNPVEGLEGESSKAEAPGEKRPA